MGLRSRRGGTVSRSWSVSCRASAVRGTRTSTLHVPERGSAISVACSGERSAHAPNHVIMADITSLSPPPARPRPSDPRTRRSEPNPIFPRLSRRIWMSRSSDISRPLGRSSGAGAARRSSGVNASRSCAGSSQGHPHPEALQRAQVVRVAVAEQRLDEPRMYARPARRAGAPLEEAQGHARAPTPPDSPRPCRGVGRAEREVGRTRA